MQPEVFMSEEPLFECFFSGRGSEEVLRCWREGLPDPPLSFPKLKVVDMLYWNFTRRFIHTLAHFYPNVRLREADVEFLPCIVNGTDGMDQSFLDETARVPAMRLNCRLSDIVAVRRGGIAAHLPHLRELRVSMPPLADLIITLEDPHEDMDKLAAQLEPLVTMQMSTTETIHQDSVVGSVVTLRPVLKARGEGVTSLHLWCEAKWFDESAIYQLINLCPRLCVLALTMRLGEMKGSVGTR